MECAYSLNGALCGLVNNPTGSGFIYHPGIVDEVFDVKSLQEWKGQRLNPVFPSLSSPLGTFVFLPFSHTEVNSGPSFSFCTKTCKNCRFCLK